MMATYHISHHAADQWQARATGGDLSAELKAATPHGIAVAGCYQLLLPSGLVAMVSVSDDGHHVVSTVVTADQNTCNQQRLAGWSHSEKRKRRRKRKDDHRMMRETPQVEKVIKSHKVKRSYTGRVGDKFLLDDEIIVEIVGITGNGNRVRLKLSSGRVVELTRLGAKGVKAE